MKKLYTYLLPLSLTALLLAGCNKDPDPIQDSLDQQLTEAIELAAAGEGLDFFTMPASNDYAAIPQDPKNPITREKVELGRLLFHETGIALAPVRPEGKGTYSCASCHFAQSGFQAGRFQGMGEGGVGFGHNGEARNRHLLYKVADLDVQPIRSPSAMNGAYQSVMLWNGQFGGSTLNIGTENSWTAGTPKENNHLGFEGLETQAIAGLTVHRLVIDKETMTKLNYKPMFDLAFPDVPESERYSKVQAGLAIGAYERTLLANEAPFQRWLRGELQAMNAAEKRGAALFFGKAECAGCHSGPSLAAMDFYAIGLSDLNDCPEETFKANPTVVENRGRGGFTGRAEDNYKFKVPQLYNISDSPFYGHGASLRTIRDVVEYKNNGVAENPNVPAAQISSKFKPLNLTAGEIDDIVAFLTTALRDPNLHRYEPGNLLSGQCFPMNDPLSRSDLGCQ